MSTKNHAAIHTTEQLLQSKFSMGDTFYYIYYDKIYTETVPEIDNRDITDDGVEMIVRKKNYNHRVDVRYIFHTFEEAKLCLINKFKNQVSAYKHTLQSALDNYNDSLDKLHKLMEMNDVE